MTHQKNVDLNARIDEMHSREKGLNSRDAELRLREEEVNRREAAVVEKKTRLEELRALSEQLEVAQHFVKSENIELDNREADLRQRSAPTQTHGLTGELTQQHYNRLREPLDDRRWAYDGSVTCLSGENVTHAFLSYSQNGTVMYETYVAKDLL
jgi:hypothetical protein